MTSVIALFTGLSLITAPAVAAAPEAQTTKLPDQTVANLLLKLLGQQDETSANLKEARSILAEAKVVAAAAARGSSQTVDLAPFTERVTTLEERLTEINEGIALLQGAINGKADKVEVEALVARLVTLENREAPEPYDDAPIKARLTVLENAALVDHSTHTTEIVTADFNPIVYVGGGVVMTKSYLPAYGEVSSRLVAGVRPALEIGDGVAEAAFDFEANWTPQIGVGNGFGIRVVPSILGSYSWGDLGFGLGASYDCSVLTPDACLAEHVGGLARGTAVIGGSMGVRLNADLEVNYLTVSAVPEVRAVVGVACYGGRRHVTYVQ